MSIPMEESKTPDNQLIEEDPYLPANASGMGQTRGMSVFSAEGEDIEM